MRERDTQTRLLFAPVTLTFTRDLDLDPMTFILKPDLDVLKTYLHTEKYYHAAFSGGNEFRVRVRLRKGLASFYV